MTDTWQAALAGEHRMCGWSLDLGDRHKREGNPPPRDLGKNRCQEGVEVVQSKYGVGCRLLGQYGNFGSDHP